jgi:hypothetical protein
VWEEREMLMPWQANVSTRLRCCESLGFAVAVELVFWPRMTGLVPFLYGISKLAEEHFS